MKKIAFLIFLISFLSILGYVSYLLQQPYTSETILSPKAEVEYIPPPKRIVGFLPFWQLIDVDTYDYSLLNEVIYFSITLDEKGNIAKTDSDGNAEPGFAKLTSDNFKKLVSQTKRKNTKLTIAIVLHENEKIETFLKDQDAQENSIHNIQTLLTTYGFSGVNLDFEYSGVPAKETIDGYSAYAALVNQKLKEKNQNALVSVDVTADAIKKSRLYDVESLAKAVDYVFLMGYDFYRPSSSVAGPIAPLTGKEIYEYDITTAVADFESVMPKGKLVLAVAYYGWDFPTIDETRGSFVEKRPDEAVAVSSYNRNRRFIKENTGELKFDLESQTPWIVYKDPDTGGTRQIWFENEVSLGKKYDLINKEQLAGVALWALDYQGDYPDLWNLLKEKFRK